MTDLQTAIRRRSILCCALAYFFVANCQGPSLAAQPTILKPADYAHYVDGFNQLETEPVDSLIPDDKSWDWIVANAPLFDCPDKAFQEIYFFRWWTFRKHIVETPAGLVITEFIIPVGHAGPYNTVSSAFGHQIAEGRWLGDQKPLDDYTRFWFHSGPEGGPASHFHKFSSWAAAALYDQYLVTINRDFLVGMLDDLVADYHRWEEERQRPDGLFWQFDVADGMEESISGGRKAKNVRPTINSYMVANAAAISHIAALAGRDELAAEFAAKSDSLRQKMIDSLWDPEAKFFKVRMESGDVSDAREAIGYIPWMFELAQPDQSEAWRQIDDPTGFQAPWGLTTAERRHPKFRTHGTGKCEWDGAVWPYATSQTLRALANVLRGPAQQFISKDDYFRQLVTYARSQHQNGKPYIGEYLDETTGEWLITGPKARRSRFYNHSTFNDLVIGGLVGIVPRADDTLEVNPLVPPDAWEWFCLDGVPYHGHSISVVWDRTGEHYHRGAGFAVWCDGKELVRSPTLGRITAVLPPPTVN